MSFVPARGCNSYVADQAPSARKATAATSPSTSRCPVEAALAKAESLGGTRLMGPDQVMEGLEIGQFSDPEGHMVGLLKGAS